MYVRSVVLDISVALGEPELRPPPGATITAGALPRNSSSDVKRSDDYSK